MPLLEGLEAIDIGTGSGLLAIVAMLQGARRVYITDTNETAIEVAITNARLNGVQAGIVHLPVVENVMLPLPHGDRLDLIISNPAQLPLPQRAGADSGYYAGEEGRAMIDAIIAEAPSRLKPGGRLLMTHNSLANFPKSLIQLRDAGMECTVLAEKRIAFRPFVDRAWLDKLGGKAIGLYDERDGEPFETLYILEARRSA